MKMKKMIALLLTLFIAASLITGCEENEKVESVVPATKVEEVNDQTEEFLVSGEPVELSIHMHYWNNTAFQNDWKVFARAAQMTNVSLKGTASMTATDSKEALNMMLDSGQISDLVSGQMSELRKNFTEGIFLPLNDMIEKEAPNFKAYLEEHPVVKEALTEPDGNIYMVPYIMTDPVKKQWFIRQDWLDKLGLEVPTTKDEVYNVLKAFVERDPNGNGKKDEVGYFLRDCSAATRDLLPLFGVPEYWMLQGDTVINGYNHPGLKDAMMEIAQWYQEGLIDPEIFTRGNGARDVMLGEDLAGFTHDWTPSTANYNELLSETIPGFNFVVIAPPNTQTGKAWDYSSTSPEIDFSQQGIAISAGTKYPDIAMKYLDFWWSEEGRRLANFGIEGEEYEMVDGKPKYLDSFLNSEGAVVDKLRKIGAQSPFAYVMDYDYVLQTLHPAAIEGIKLYQDNHYAMEPFPTLTFTEEEQSYINSKMTSIDNYYLDQAKKWILGVEDVAATFDAYLDKINKLGLDDVIAIYQKAYERQNS